MTQAAPAIPTWTGFALRCVIYGAVLALAYWYSPFVAAGISLPLLSDLLHAAADTVRRRTGYIPIPRHPAFSKTPAEPLKLKARPIAILFVLVWLAITLIGKQVTGATWLEAVMQGLAMAMMVAIFGAMFFTALAMALLWVCAILIGVFLSIADLVTIFLASPEQKKTWHRNIDQYDHRLADIILGQNAAIPLRASLAERAAEDARHAK